jgi:hypothetical protein
MRKIALVLALFLLGGLPSFGQGNNMPPAPAFSGAITNRSTLNGSVVIATGNTFQIVLASNFGTTTQRQQLTVNNNNFTVPDNCWIFLGSGTATKAASIMLVPGASYRREWPFVPSDTIQATCTTTSDTLYIDTQ